MTRTSRSLAAVVLFLAVAALAAAQGHAGKVTAVDAKGKVFTISELRTNPDGSKTPVPASFAWNAATRFTLNGKAATDDTLKAGLTAAVNASPTKTGPLLALAVGLTTAP